MGRTEVTEIAARQVYFGFMANPTANMLPFLSLS